MGWLRLRESSTRSQLRLRLLVEENKSLDFLKLTTNFLKYVLTHVPVHVGPAELGTRQFFSFATTTTRQRNRASRTSQGPEKIRKIVRPQCLHWVTTTNIVKLQLLTYLWPENMVKLSRKNCRVPSSAAL